MVHRKHKMQIIPSTNGVPIKAWVDGVEVEQEALTQVRNLSTMPFIFKWLALMPDVHAGKGSTVGSVIPTSKAIIPAGVGVDIGCGVCAIKLSLNANHLPDNLHDVRLKIESAIPCGRTDNGGKNDRGAWHDIPQRVVGVWNSKLDRGFKSIIKKYPKLEKGNTLNHLGSLGSGNHYFELCLDESDNVWLMLHSGSRGVGNRIGQFFITMAKEEMRIHHAALPDKDLAYLQEGTKSFDDYVEALSWAQDFARINRELMMENAVYALKKVLPPFQIIHDEAVNCHHNYVQKEEHYGENIWITRKGAVSARKGEMGIIPGSMGAKSFIVRGLGNPESFMSCSHGAGRKMSRTQAKKLYTIEDHIKATEGIECRKDADVIDETPMAYKDIMKVMEAQKDLVETVHELHQLVCVKG